MTDKKQDVDKSENRNMSSKIFISYSRKDLEVVKKLRNEIYHRTGVKPWMDVTGIETGAQFVNVIAKNIEVCELLIFVMSCSSIESSWTRKEVVYAQKRGKKIYPVIIDDAQLPRGLDFLFSDVDRVDVRDSTQREKLFDDLLKFCGGQGSEKISSRDQTSSPGEEITTEQLFPDKKLVNDPPVKSEGNVLPRRNGSRGSAIKILMVGATAAGKTVAIAGLGELASSCPDEDGYFFEPDPQTESFVDKTIARMRQGEWPTQTLQLHCLNWNIKRRGADVRKRPQTICKMSIIEFPGEFCRASHDRDIDLLKKNVAAADCIIVLISLRDVILSEGSRDRDCISKSILRAIFSDDTRVKRPIVAIALSCADEYGDVIRACGGPKGVIKKYQPRIAMNYGWLNVLAVSAVDKTVLAPDGSKFPSSDFTTKGLRPLMSWILLSRRNVVTRAVRTLVLRLLWCFSAIVIMVIVTSFLIWCHQIQAEKMKSIQYGDQKAFKQINKPSSDYSVKALL